MFVVFFISVISIFFAYTAKLKNRYGLEIAFLNIILFLALRYNFGSDYPAYHELFNVINESGVDIWDLQALSDLSNKGEVGWILLNRLFAPLGFFGLIAFLAIFENIILYRFIKKYIPTDYYWIPIVLLTCNSSLILIGACSMLRQWLAAILFIWASQYIIERKPWKYFLLVFIAISIHTTAMVLLPLYLLTYIKPIKTFSWKQISIMAILYFAWSYYMPSVFEANIGQLLDNEKFDSYSTYLEDEISANKMNLFGMISYFLKNIFLPLIVLIKLPQFPKSLQVLSYI